MGNQNNSAHQITYQNIITQSIKIHSESMFIPTNNIKQPSRPITLLKSYKHNFQSSKLKNLIQSQTNKPSQQIIQEHNSSKYLDKEWPYISIGLIQSNNYQQNGNNQRIHGIGTLIHNNMILTSAHNVYNRQLNKQYSDIKFIQRLDVANQNSAYSIKKLYYPPEYKQSNGHQQEYNFAVLELQVDLSDHYGYLGLKIHPDHVENLQNQTNSKITQQFQKMKYQIYPESYGYPIITKDNNNNYYVTGIVNSKDNKLYITKQITSIINKWIFNTELNLGSRNLGSEICKHLIDYKFHNLKKINLYSNNLNAQGCRYLKQNQLPMLTDINLSYNQIGQQGFMHLMQAKWPNLIGIIISNCNIGSKGCQYLKEANWVHLKMIDLNYNNIDAEACKYIKDSNFVCLQTLWLANNRIDNQGCKYLKEANWPQLKIIYLTSNLITNEGCYYLKDLDWSDLQEILLYQNDVSSKNKLVLKLQKLMRF